MLIYITKKIVSLLLILLLLSLLGFALIYYAAADNSYQQLNFVKGYYTFYQHIFSNQFMISSHETISFWKVITEILSPTFQLCLLVIFCATVIGFPLGILLAFTQNNTLSHFIKIGCLILYACPIIWVAILLVTIPYFEWSYFENPASPPTITGFSLIDLMLSSDSNKWSLFYFELRRLFLPVFILTIQPCILTIQTISQHVSETAQKNYIKVAKIRENSPIKLLLRHLLPNALPEAVPQLAYNATTLLLSTMVIEILFEQQGLGVWVFSAFLEQNYYFITLAILSCGILSSVITLLSELLVIMVSPIKIRSSYE